ncbi:MAG: class I SAM-dependent methyltransferase [Solirubrobacteraceae bacterium]
MAQSRSSQKRAGTSVMAGKGLYNEHSQPQHVAGEDGVPMLRRAAASVSLESLQSTTIVDYGSSQGRNSLMPMSAAIDTLRERMDAQLPISVVHTDLPANDFAALFETLQADPHSYLRDRANVFAFAVGRSFYERLLPGGAVSLGWSSITVHWLSAVPCELPEQIFSPLAQPQQRAAFAQRAAENWRRFLGHRLEELRPGGQLVVVGSGADERGRSGAEGLMELANEALQQMVADGLLARADYEQMVLPTYYRTADEFTDPLADDWAHGSFALEECTQTDLDDPLWQRFESSGDNADYAASAAGFLRAFSEPSLFATLARRQPAEQVVRLADEFYERVRVAIEQRPEQARCAWRLVLMRIAKRA